MVRSLQTNSTLSLPLPLLLRIPNFTLLRFSSAECVSRQGKKAKTILSRAGRQTALGESVFGSLPLLPPRSTPFSVASIGTISITLLACTLQKVSISPSHPSAESVCLSVCLSVPCCMCVCCSFPPFKLKTEPVEEMRVEKREAAHESHSSDRREGRTDLR